MDRITRERPQSSAPVSQDLPPPAPDLRRAHVVSAPIHCRREEIADARPAGMCGKSRASGRDPHFADVAAAASSLLCFASGHRLASDSGLLVLFHGVLCENRWSPARAPSGPECGHESIMFAFDRLICSTKLTIQRGIRAFCSDLTQLASRAHSRARPQKCWRWPRLCRSWRKAG